MASTALTAMNSQWLGPTMTGATLSTWLTGAGIDGWTTAGRYSVPSPGPTPQWLWQWRLRGSSSEEGSQKPGASPVRNNKLARLEAVLFVADAAISPRRLAVLALLADATEARTLVNKLNEAYDVTGSAFRVERVAGGFRLLTRPEFALWLGKLHQRQAELQLSPPAIETLSVIAYRQPITRADIEAVRGVQCAEMLKQLMDRGLVRICGEDDGLGHPFLYETTRAFLEIFGLRDLEDLPLAEKLLRNRPSSPAA